MKKIWNKLVSNWGLKLASLFIAFLLWFVVISIDGDPVGSKTLSNVPITLLNAELVTSKGMIYEFLDGTDVLRSVSLEAPKSVRDEIEAGDIVAEADFNDLTVANTIAIKFSCPKYNGKVTDISGNFATVRLNIESERTAWINIEANVTGEVAEDYLINQVRLDQNRLRLSGPESQITQVAKAVVDVNVEGISNNIATRVDVKLQDAEGNPVSYPKLSKNFDTVNVTVTVNATKEVPLEFGVMGSPEEGFMMTGALESNPERILVAGDRNTLAGLERLVIPENALDITGVSETVERTIELSSYLPAGVSFADSTFDGAVLVTVYVEEVVDRRLVLNPDRISFAGVPEGVRVAFPEEMGVIYVQIRGLEKEIATLREAGVSGVIHVDRWIEDYMAGGIHSGEYELPVRIPVTENLSVIGRVTVPVSITVE